MDIAELSIFAQSLLAPAHAVLREGFQLLVARLRDDAQLRALALRDGINAALSADTSALKDLQKKNKEFVTAAEINAERTMRELVQKKYPGHAFIGEELGVLPGKDYTWVFDPIDGTSAMLRCALARAYDLPIGAPAPAFGISIAVLDSQSAVVGVIGEVSTVGDSLEMPNIWVGAKGFPTIQNAEVITASPARELKDAVLSCTIPGVMFHTKETWSGFQSLADSCGSLLTDQNCIGYMHLLNGAVDIVFERDLTLPDAAALEPILRGAGLKVTNDEGKPISFSTEARNSEYILLAAAPALHVQALAAVRLGVSDQENRFSARSSTTKGYAKKF